MKYLFFYTLLIFVNVCFANMASPLQQGTSLSTVFTSRNINIVNEKIHLIIDDDFKTGKYIIEYHITTDTTGVQIPLLFFALDYQDEFKVYVDNKEVNLLELHSKKSGNALKKISNQFTFIYNQGLLKEIVLNFGDDYNQKYNLNYLKYFEIELSHGEHIVKVEYIAEAWNYHSDWITHRSFRYSLSPVKYWKSFGGIDIFIDNTKSKKEISTNLGLPTSGVTDSIATWHFDKLPKDFLMVTHIPKINAFASLLIDLDPSGLTVIFGLFISLLHVFSIYKFRKKNTFVRFSWVSLFGSFIVPLITLISYILFFGVIESVIGEEGGGGRHGYIFLALLLYLPLMPVYLILMQIIDYYFKEKFKIFL